MLTSFKAQTGELVFEDKRMVVVSHCHDDVEADLVDKAQRIFRVWFDNHYPESTLLYYQAHPTIGEESEPQAGGEATESPFSHGGWKSSDSIPRPKNEELSEDVLIDCWGTREMFRVGYFRHADNTWYAYDKQIIAIDADDMRWCPLPLNLLEKSWIKKKR